MVTFAQMFEYLLSHLICVKLNQTVKNIDLEFNVLAEQYSLEALFKIYEDFQRAKQYPRAECPKQSGY